MSAIPADLVAELTRPTESLVVAMAAASPAAASPSIVNAMTNTFAAAAMRKGKTLTHAFGGGLPAEATTPKLTRAVEVEMSQQEMIGQPTVSRVVVQATVDLYGYPRDLEIVQSAGTLLDDRAMAAVSQYRFQPAMLDNSPVSAPVTITIKIQKP
jgi:TonB family protein